MIEHISIVIITRNAADTLTATLDSVRDFKHVVVWDNASEDGTLDLLGDYPNVELHQAEFLGFGPSKNAAADCALTDWVFSLDADEQLDDNLVTALRQWTGDDVHAVGEILRQNQLMGRTVRRGGWGDDRLVRLFHRRHHRFTDAAVHEKVATTSRTRVVRLAGHLKHDAVRHLGQFLQKVDRYTEIRRETHTRTYPVPIIVAKAMFAFVRSYFMELGVLAGWRGVAIAWSNANGTFYKYMKILADKKVAAERHPPNG